MLFVRLELSGKEEEVIKKACSIQRRSAKNFCLYHIVRAAERVVDENSPVCCPENETVGNNESR